jgi:hypothetical protein
MAQIFKTISLEERLKNSSYNNIAQQPKAVQQGSVTIQPYKAALSLNNSSTIQITPFGIFNHTSDITIQPYNSTIVQGGLNPIIFNYTPNQGGVTPNIINISLNQGGFTPLLLNFIPNQGGTLPTTIVFAPNQGGLNPILFGFIPNQGSIKALPWGFLPTQGSTTLSSYLFAPTQGGTNPTIITFVPYQGLVKPPPHLFIPNQGSTTIGNWVTVQNQGGVTPILFSFIPNQGGTTIPLYGTVQNQGGITPAPYKPIILQGGILPKYIGSSIVQGGTLVKSYVPANNRRVPSSIYLGYTGAANSWRISGLRNVINPTAKQGSIVLNVLRYEADRALAAFTPEIKHGGTFNEATLISRDLIDEYKDSSTRPVSPSGNAYNSLLPAGVEEIPAGYKESLESALQNDIYPTLQSQIGNVSLEGYKALSYLELGIEAKNETNKLANNANTHRTLETGTIDHQGKTDVGALDRKVNDFITFKVKSIRDSTTTNEISVHFKAYLTAFNDSYTVNWNDINYIGRQETLKAFKGVTRNVSLSFKIAAMTRIDMEYMYQKLNRLVQIAAVGAVGGETYVYGPICSLTLGKWFVDTVCVFNSVKFDIQPTEYSWDVGDPNDEEADSYELPHIVDVSLDASILLTNDNGRYNSTANFFSEIPTRAPAARFRL